MAENTIFSSLELADLHEIMALEIFTSQKIKNQMETVEDKELKEFMTESLRRKQQRVDDMGKIISSTITIRQLNGM